MSTKTTTDKKPAKASAVASTVSYSINDKGQVVRTDHKGDLVLATLDEAGGLAYESKATRKLHPAVIRYLNDEKIPFNADLVTTKADDKAEAETLDDEHTAEFNASIPKPPKKTPEQGDKTPRYVEWLKTHKPKTYRQKYGIVGSGTVTKWRDTLDERGRPTKVSYQVQAILSARKTHLTEKIEAADQNDDGETED